MSTASYRNTILEAVADVLRPVGFRKTGARFNRTLKDVVHLISTQSSTGSTAASLRVTVNLGISISSLVDKGDKPDVWSAHWRERLGFLMPGHHDRWWEVSSDREAAAAALEIAQATKTFALQAFDTLSTVDALVALWRAGRSPGLTESVARRYLDILDRRTIAG